MGSWGKGGKKEKKNRKKRRIDRFFVCYHRYLRLLGIEIKRIRTFEGFI